MSTNEIWQYTIYFDALDYPGHFVVRAWCIGPCYYCGKPHVLPLQGPLQMWDSLGEARDLVPPELFKLTRFADDDPKIVEVWT